MLKSFWFYFLLTPVVISTIALSSMFVHVNSCECGSFSLSVQNLCGIPPGTHMSVHNSTPWWPFSEIQKRGFVCFFALYFWCLCGSIFKWIFTRLPKSDTIYEKTMPRCIPSWKPVFHICLILAPNFYPLNLKCFTWFLRRPRKIRRPVGVWEFSRLSRRSLSPAFAFDFGAATSFSLRSRVTS